MTKRRNPFAELKLCRLGCMLLALLSWIPVMKTQQLQQPVDSYDSSSSSGSNDNLNLQPQATTDMGFPYCDCARNTPSPYRFLPTVTVKKPGLYCMTLLVNTTGCTGRCCNVDLRKIEFDVNPRCNVRGTTVKSTVNGVYTSTGPNFYWYQNSDKSNKFVLRITNLNMGVGDSTSQICVNLTATAKDGCDSLEKLCAPPFASAAPGTCQLAIFNSPNYTDSCCPTRLVSLPPSPPPPPRPPSPSPPSTYLIGHPLLPPTLKPSPPPRSPSPNP
ncbi:hypothetical protein VaNZ11_015116, partial [Volvox africanus]